MSRVKDNNMETKIQNKNEINNVKEEDEGMMKPPPLISTKSNLPVPNRSTGSTLDLFSNTLKSQANLEDAFDRKHDNETKRKSLKHADEMMKEKKISSKALLSLEGNNAVKKSESTLNRESSSYLKVESKVYYIIIFKNFIL